MCAYASSLCRIILIDVQWVTGKERPHAMQTTMQSNDGESNPGVSTPTLLSGTH